MSNGIWFEKLDNQKWVHVAHDNPLPVMIGNSETSQFGEVLTVTRTPIIELNSSYGTSALRDVETVANNGTITATGGEIKLSTSATANGSAILESAERGRYIPGYGAEVGVGARIPTDPSGNQELKWGARDSNSANDGFYFGMDATGIYTAILNDGTETKTRPAEWNIDPLDGTGPSGYTLDVSSGLIYQIDFTWYGYGQIVWGVVGVVNDNQQFIPCHQLKVDGEVSVASPNLAVFAEADNGGDTSNVDLYIGGRQYSIIGTYRPKFRFTGQERGSVSTSTTTKPLVSFRTKTAFIDRSVRIAGFDAIVATENIVVEVRLNGALTGASWTTPANHTASETALEADVSASAITGGEVIWSQLLPAGQANKADFTSGIVSVDIPQEQVVTLCARTLANTGTVISHFRMEEEW